MSLAAYLREKSRRRGLLFRTTVDRAPAIGYVWTSPMGQTYTVTHLLGLDDGRVEVWGERVRTMR